jgi:hypothetical protein
MWPSSTTGSPPSVRPAPVSTRGYRWIEGGGNDRAGEKLRSISVEDLLAEPVEL